MNYVKFADLYDELMSDAPYEQWVSFVLKVVEMNGRKNGHVLDVGCGTGNIAIPLSKIGVKVTAVDLSEEMLIVAKEKNEAAGTKVEFFQQDMRNLEGLGTYDTVISLCDCLNYLNDEAELKSTFQKIYEHLNINGLFIFDVHSTFKIDHFFVGNTFAHNGEKIAYIWESFAGKEPHSVEHDLSFFVLNEQGSYDRYDELHKQRTYPIKNYEHLLESAGFKILSITGDFSLETLTKDCERLFFVAQKI